MLLRPIAVALYLRRTPRLRCFAALASSRATSSRRMLPRLRLSTHLPKVDVNCMPLCSAIWKIELRVPYSFYCLLPAGGTQHMQMLTRIGAQSRSTPTNCMQSRYECTQTAKKNALKKRYAFSQTLLSVAALLIKWRAAQQMACKKKNLETTKPRRHKPRHRDISVSISPRAQN